MAMHRTHGESIEKSPLPSISFLDLTGAPNCYIYSEGYVGICVRFRLSHNQMTAFFFFSLICLRILLWFSESTPWLLSMLRVLSPDA